MKTYFLCPRASLDVYIAKMCKGEAYNDVHWIDTLADGSPMANDMALVVMIDGAQGDNDFLSSLDGVVTLPGLMDTTPITDPMQPQKLDDSHSAALASLGAGAQDTTSSLAKKAALLHRSFHPLGF